MLTVANTIALVAALLFSTHCGDSDGSGGSSTAGAPAGAGGTGGSGGAPDVGGEGTGATGGTPDTCGDSVCDGAETCRSCEQDCGVCEPPIEVPASLVDTIDAQPYVEEDCSPTTYEGWPYDAQSCTYTAEGVTATVIVANPAPERVGRWIVDAASYIPALAALKGVDDGAYEEGLSAIGLAMMYQSSRIFPLSGGIVEDLGNGPVVYDFENGITTTCSSGCYCRINSLHRTQWCEYRASLGDDYDGCIADVGDSGYTEGWAAQCLSNHVNAWTSDANEHFRARAYVANLEIDASCPDGQCSPDGVVDAVRSAYGL
ncbi:MAG: hypothetical protein HOW73_04745 [Polyangiaceae bacterium]|nr:hypothetical protein [Polyangiaceae bacterium]